jgi:hypothetical protein
MLRNCLAKISAMKKHYSTDGCTYDVYEYEHVSTLICVE